MHGWWIRLAYWVPLGLAAWGLLFWLIAKLIP